uniref:Large ribosomal subunit protein uL5c n=1 Tax=Nephroselmis astigmatica TaxID=259378 RepID=A0A088CJE6_9CHLO|nr:ribosomal protein L5 [Nephroselmis astigmatica]AID67721.1 ribosomal protein L5 [Nephroselmis astigmatica]
MIMQQSSLTKKGGHVGVVSLAPLLANYEIKILPRLSRWLQKSFKFKNITRELQSMPQRLKNFYLDSVLPKLQDQFQYTNLHQVPYVQKIVINRGLGEASQNAKILEASIKEMGIIAGQRGVVTKAKKAIASFKVREEMPVGISVTLRGERMYGFLDRLINLALPRIRDFHGINPESFDGHGNYSLGLEEQLMFPEIDYDSIEKVRGMDISIITSASNDQEGLALLAGLGMPFRNPAVESD